MKLFTCLLIIMYSIYLNCFFSNFNINILCKNLATFTSSTYFLLYCKEKDGVDIYKYDIKTKKIHSYGFVKGGKDTLYFVGFIHNIEVFVKVTPKFIKISNYQLGLKRRFLNSKLIRNHSSIDEYTEDIFVDINCDGFKDIVIPHPRFYKIYIAIVKNNSVEFKLFKKLSCGFIEMRRKESFYDNIWFKIGYSLPKIYSFKFKHRCYNLVYYLSGGIIKVYKNSFKNRVARITTIKDKDKYEEFIVYPRPEPFIYCNRQCKVVHFDHRRGLIFTSLLYYPYKSESRQFVKGAILNFTPLSDNIYWVTYLPKLNFIDFYELLTKNVLDIKLVIVVEQNGIFKIVYEFPLTVKINLNDEKGFISVRAGNFVCIKNMAKKVMMVFSEKDAVYKYILDLSNPLKPKEIEKLKTENPIELIEKYNCLGNGESVIIFDLYGRVNYLEKK